MNNINSISINDDFWIRFEPHCINFRFIGLPKDIHYTIAFNSNSPDINFHISKNCGQPNNKPKIEILRINKQILEEDSEKLCLRLLNMILEEIQPSLSESSWVLPFEDENSESSQLIRAKLKEKVQENIEIKRKKKLKFTGEIGDKLEEFVKDEDVLKSLHDNIVKVSDKPIESTLPAMLLIDGETIPIIQIQGKWYKIKQLSPIEFTSIFINQEIAKSLLPMIRRAIVIVNRSNSWDETKPYNEPIVLIRK